MTWEDIKKHIYHEDGSLRDIYIRNVASEDWIRWVDFVNSSYTVDFEIGGKLKGNKIDFSTVAAYWQHVDQECPSASIYLGDIIVKTYFFREDEIENDITPREIKTVEDHKKLVAYLRSVSNLLGKPVELTEENYSDPHEVLMIINGEQVTFP